MNQTALAKSRQVLSELIVAQTQKRKASAVALYDEDTLSNLFREIKAKSLGADLDVAKMILFIQAKRLKDELLTEAFAEAKSRGTYFAYTLNISWKKDPLTFTVKYLTEPELSGRPDGIYWYVKKGSKINGKVVFFFERIANKKDSFEYSSRAFKGAKDWELDLIMKYERRFAVIRKMLSSIADIQRRGYTLEKNYEKLCTEVNADHAVAAANEQVPNDLMDALS